MNLILALSTIGALTNLVFLNLGNCPEISDAGMSQLANLFKLQTLNIRTLTKITNASAISCFYCDFLSFLLIFSSGLNVVATFTSLLDLDLGGCYNIGDEGLLKLSSLKLLEHFNISQC